MRWHVLMLVVAVALAGCQAPRTPLVDASDRAFGPQAMRIHPIFSQVEDWTGDGKVDGIEALLEFSDLFGDPTKSAGRVVFELFEYRTNSPDPRGQRVVSPWVASIATLDEQRARWSRTSGAYRFQLAWEQVRGDRSYVLSATYESTSGQRFFDRVILTPAEENNGGDDTSARGAAAGPAGAS